MNAKYIAAALSAALLSVSTVSIADNGIQYNYGELRYVVDADLDGYDVDGDGLAFGGSFRIDELFYAVADYEAIDYDDNIDTSVLQVGLGVIFPYEKIDFIAEAAINSSDADSPVKDDTGFRLTAGGRTYVMPELEVRATVNYSDIFDENDTYLTVSADYFLGKSFSINASKDLAADVDRFSIGVRYYFGK
jgi:hypothetical protein